MKKIIEFKNITKSFKNKKILKDINLSINKGELVVLIGPSGCGKTTTLKMINKLIEPTSGKIFVDGKNITKENTIKLRRQMGYVIQQTGLMPHLTVSENIGLIPHLEKLPYEKIEKKIIELLQLVSLKPKTYMDRFPKELSGGQQQRIGVARAFATDPEIILMDEPFSALDPITRNQLQDELFELQQKMKRTIVFVTHDMDEALKLADRICIMKDGQIIQYDTPENILKNPSHGFVEEFIGKNRIWSQPEFIKAKDIMIESPVKASPNRTIMQGIQIMKKNKVDSLLIVDEENNLKGISTLKSIHGETDKSLKLKDIMSEDIITATDDTCILDILELVKKHNKSYIPIVDKNSHLLGLITKTSLLAVLSTQFLDQEVNN
ncbi:betaine/proline/choline family ABC transporter ATP-binding protein [Clostridium oceanicum]|uniref:Quaternary amine transport ATP-binding protein n=1 Tax=Clostridium oceanicum TaxID=1543 RepID=A0ABN1JGN8_9CLOT